MRSSRTQVWETLNKEQHNYIHAVAYFFLAVQDHLMFYKMLFSSFGLKPRLHLA